MRVTPPVALQALIGPQGHILSADAQILRLQFAAGGEEDGKLLVPQLAAVARLAQRLGLLVARSVQAAGEGTQISMWVRAQPRPEGVALTISDWRETLVPLATTSLAQQRAADMALSGEGWTWQTDALMNFTHVEGAPDGEAPATGAAFASLFALAAGANAGKGEDHPVLAAIQQQRAFFAEETVSAHGLGIYLLSGCPIESGNGVFTGYRGKAMILARPAAAPEPVEVAAEDAPAPIFPDNSIPAGQMFMPDFGKRLDLALRQPLGRIIANAETLRAQLQGPLRDDYTGYAADIADAGRHLMELIDDLADLQAIDRPNFQVACEEVDLADIARRTAGLLGLKAAEKRIQLQVPPAGESVKVMGEFRRALQIAVNLVGNAVRYSPEDSQVWLRVDEDDGMGQLIVADQGRGIPLEDQERIFDKFERLGRQDTVGSGLGLYISRRLARAMKGDIIIDSAPGLGARFILSLPKKAG